MPTAQVSRGNFANSQNTGGTTSGSLPPGASPVTWNYLGALSGLITVNVSNLNNAYVVGAQVENYLNDNANFNDADYCLVSRYNIAGVTHELRSRIVPISYFDFNLRRVVKNFRVDFQDVTNSQSICSNNLRVMNNSGTDYVFDPASPPPSLRFFGTGEICTNCTSMLSAQSIGIYKKVQVGPVTTYIDKIPLSLVNTDGLQLQIDPNYSTGGTVGTCSNNDCRSRGFDCCLENQCVRDGTAKPAAFTPQYSSIYQTAEQERLQNPLAYLNYPQIYYFCGSSVPTTTGGSGGGSPGGSYDEAFNLLKKDYSCVEHIKSQATVNPFHNELLLRTYNAATDCLTTGSSTEQMFYQNVMKRLYTTCGCNRSDLQEMINNCPAYEYKVISRDTLGVPVRIDCYTPATNIPAPAQQTVSVPSRSAPHRFFDTAGVEKEITSGAEQEGARFEYMDEGKVLPIQQNFSMNAILGQMSVALDQALPAKTVNVELDQVYFLSTTSGYYTPCPSCAKDSWLGSLTAFPSSSTGVGLQAIGHTTQRDMFSTNTTGGNYEDTIFGRACWLPPTMIPYTHSPRSSVQEQRTNRLQTQAALFVNGYQRDWFGFNKGALIGSFDGVTWFAIGKGRIVRSTSKKLFLAINAPFADVASATTHVVRVHAYDGITQAAQVDYDPQYHQYHPFQNEAGNCQQNHLCSTDTDCVTKLGWEYVCADVRDLKTNWPEFDGDGNEKPAISNNLTLDQILQQKRFPSSSTKRCVYRGAGSLCHASSGNLPGTDLNKKKLLTCAPNFFCSKASSSGFHNTKIARFAANLDEIPVSRNHFFGKDANILGRPLDYLATGGLNTDIHNTLRENLTPIEATASTNTGLCQPGKKLPTTTDQVTFSNPFNQHISGDTTRRADYINQIGSCNSTLFTTNRHSSCPVMGSDNNYEMFATATIVPGFANRATNQNACGLESLLPSASLNATADTLQNSSPFKAIEARPLNSQIIVDPTMVRDACLRRAGAVCHTDLDCSPNKMHATQVDFFGTTYFGNNAEKSYYSEYLVCGQADPKPFPSETEAFKNYDMSKNRCCREVGKDLTTYTADIAQDTFVNTLTPYDPASAGLLMSLAPGIQPNNPRRYSRLATVEGLGITKPILTANQDRAGNFIDSTKPNLMTPDQWKTISEANSESCCGGGWIRKFSDGSNDWSRRDRLIMDVSNFRCINSRTPLLTNPGALAFGGRYTNAADAETLVSQDYGDYCKDATNTNGSCAQYTIKDSALDILPKTTGADYLTTTVNTIKPVYTLAANPDFYFTPRSADFNGEVIVDYSNADARRNITIKVPSYVSRLFDTAYTATADGASSGTVPISMVLEDGTGLFCTKRTVFNPTSPTQSVGVGPSGAIQSCHYSYNTVTRILKVGANDLAAANIFVSKKVGIEFTVDTAGRALISRMLPGTNAYYLKRLGRLELTGIPQVTFEEMACNDDSSKIVPGIFKVGINNTTDFVNNNYSFLHGYLAKNDDGTDALVARRFTNIHGLQHEPVFSANDFKCCSPLGKTVTNSNVCCSGFGTPVSQGSTSKICALPPGTNLMVYFNRFVSNEGRGTEAPGGGLVDADFETQTGEPKLSAPVNDKIRALGNTYCASGKVRQGGAFGNFEVEPQGSSTTTSDRIYNIVDSSRDIGQSSNAGTTTISGYPAFYDGFRWNHHLYCDD
jgi:hypothetical protein